MGRIHVLPDQLINRIAAGEVVERPASVVKELIENGLDAGARSIQVTLLSGGKRLIRVRDDGCGMDRDDALLAVERHATSKLGGPEDLGAIRSFGFRGEALSSIAAVSRFVLASAVTDGEGTEVEVQAGRIRSVRQAGLPRGTSVQVERLFHNVPARRKFLRADATELSHIVRWVTRCALAHPGVRFRLEQSDRIVLRADPALSLLERVGQLFGPAFAKKLLPFELESEGLRIHGLAGRPADAGPRREGQQHFVNGRPVQDRVLSHAVSEAYGNTTPRGRYPSMILFVTLDPSEVDVNVHPQKHEVRFHGAQRVHDAVRDAIARSLSAEAVVPELADLRPSGAGELRPGDSGAIAGSLAVAEPARSRSEGFAAGGRPYLPARESESPRPEPAAGPPDRRLGDPAEAMEPLGESFSARKAVPLAQYRQSYIVAQDRSGLLLVDQHAAHERVLFERYLEDAERNRVEVQRLLFPVTLELAPHERILLAEEADEFRRLGFRLQPFGGDAIRLDGVPAVAADLEPGGLLRELIGEAAQARSASSDVAGLRRRIVTSAACQAAIKVNNPLAADTMQALLDDLFATVNPSTCPHGRPAVFRLTHEELERAFRRR